jgi:molybdopterin molybdotransferase
MELEEAISALKKHLSPLTENENCPILDSYGRIAACDVFAPINVPPFPKSAMDGYAVRASDVAVAAENAPVELKVVGELFAGDWIEAPFGEGALRVMTGSPVPKGFDAVVMQEDTDYGEDIVRIYKSVRPGQNYCAIGEDIKKGQLVLKAGTKIGRIHIGSLASLGIAEIKVLRKVRIAIISTGSELTEGGKPLSPGKIYSSIGFALSCALQNAGQKVNVLKNVEDDAEKISSALLEALSASDFVITTGGVSVGKKDLLPSVLSSIGAKILFSHVSIQPGTPTMAGILNGKLILCLSGNPYAALANFDIYAYHALSALTGCKNFEPERKDAVLETPYEKQNALRRLVRAKYDGGKVSIPVSNHASSVISNMEECNCYIDVSAKTSLKPGDKVSVIMIKD